MILKLYQIDAFADKIFQGNPAAVVPLNDWLPDEILQNIALENNLSETAFFVSKNDGFHLRWFTPTREIELCGHATLAASYVLFNILNYSKREIIFSTKSGELIVRKRENRFVMNFPSIPSYSSAAGISSIQFGNVKPIEILSSQQDLMVVFPSEHAVKSYFPTWDEVNYGGHRGLIITAQGERSDFVSRYFYTESSIDEDPVTGSAHCQLAPYWSKKLGKTVLNAEQLSRRGGALECEVKGDRVYLAGGAVFYLVGEITLPKVTSHP